MHEPAYDIEAANEFCDEFEGTPSTGTWNCPECDSVNWHNCDGCDNCDCDPDDCRESNFSWSPCDCCCSDLGGDRHDVIGWFKGAREGEYADKFKWGGAICSDCMGYLANGEVPEQ